MKRIIIVSVVMMLLFAIAAQAQTAPTAEHKKLGVWVGNWAGEGKDYDTPFGGKAGASKSTMSCEWFPGEYQIICNAESSAPASKSKSLMIFTYATEKKQYLFLAMTSLGVFAMPSIKVDGSVWTTQDSFASGGKTYQIRVVNNFVSAKECTVKIEYSEDGRNWKIVSEGKATKK